MKLFVDSSSKYLYIDILVNDKVLNTFRVGKNDHSEMLVTTLELFLKENNLNINDVKEIYIGRGPGSYTGVRISGTFGKTLAFLKNLKLYSFSSLDYLLSNYLNKDGKYIAYIEAKKNHIYTKAITVSNNNIQVDLEETFSHIDLLNEYSDYTHIIPNEENGNILNILNNNLYIEEDYFEYTPNYIRSEFN